MRFSPQLTLRDLLVLVAILGVSLGLAAHFNRHPETFPEIVPPSRVPQGAVEGMLTGAGLLAFFVAVRWRATQWRRARAALFSLVGFAFIWFAAVDWVRHVEWCGRCHRWAGDDQYRVYRIPMWTMPYHQRDHFASQIAADLGVPCVHTVTNREQWIRAWGLLVLYPRVGGTLSLWGGPYAEIQPYVLAMGRENPKLGDEFYRRAIEEDDRAYIRQFMAEIRARQAADEGEPPASEPSMDAVQSTEY